MRQRVLVCGGAGFVGSSLALKLKESFSECEILAFDSLKRRGSELAIGRLRAAGVDFVHGDIRNSEDLEQLEHFDLLLECSAEPSVQAGYEGAPRYLLNTNLLGTINCLEKARECGAGIVFLSTSRVYPIEALRTLPLEREQERLIIPDDRQGVGWSRRGVAADFPLEGCRSLYGATKLCSELLLQEYACMYGLASVINRCGVIAGPWQMGKVDQGFVSLWAATHYFGGELAYRGFDGQGLQVRDVLHVDDLFRLISAQILDLDAYQGRIFNVGGGAQNSISLRQLTNLCSGICGKSIPIKTVTDTHPSDVPYYVSDNTEVTQVTGWRPRITPTETLQDIFAWLETNASELRGVLT